MLHPEHLEPQEAIGVIFGRVETARRCTETALVRQIMSESATFALPISNGGSGDEPPRPKHTLSRQNRSRVFPPIVAPESRIVSVRVQEIKAAALDARRHNEPAHRLLDLVATSASVSWTIAAKLVDQWVGEKVDDTLVDATAAARKFWELMAQARARFFALRLIRPLPNWQGDLGHVTAQQLNEMLPGLILADHFQRREFVINYVHQDCEPALHLYTVRGDPLVVHPFLAAFCPLRFGRAREVTPPVVADRR